MGTKQQADLSEGTKREFPVPMPRASEAAAERAMRYLRDEHGIDLSKPEAKAFLEQYMRFFYLTEVESLLGTGGLSELVSQDASGD